MKTPKFNQFSVVDLSTITYDDAYTLILFLQEETRYGCGRLWKLKDAADKIKQEADRVKKAIKQARMADFMPKLEKWVVDNLKPGVRVKMKGCRDRHGIRDVLSIKTDGWNKRVSIECRQVSIDRHGNETLQGITTHYCEKLLAVFMDGKKIPVRQLVP